MNTPYQPSYRKLYESKELEKRVKQAKKVLLDCTLCPHNCHVNRQKDEKGKCNIGSEIIISSYGPHYGEESVLVGSKGSGTIFFSGCNLFCVFCQNYETSQQQQGYQVSVDGLAEIMIELQELGCANINFVTPSHMIHALLEAVLKACENGLKIPLVYNSGGYDNISSLKLLEGIIDIYLPDVKYADEESALEYSGIPNYPKIIKKALKEMHRQVGVLNVVDDVAVKGLLIRHLVLPDKIAGTEELIEFIANDISDKTAINIMDQYYPAYKASQYSSLKRRIKKKEYREAVKAAESAGLNPF